MKIKLTITRIFESEPAPFLGEGRVMYPFSVKEIQKDKYYDAVFYSMKPIPKDARFCTCNLAVVEKKLTLTNKVFE